MEGRVKGVFDRERTYELELIGDRDAVSAVILELIAAVSRQAYTMLQSRNRTHRV